MNMKETLKPVSSRKQLLFAFFLLSCACNKPQAAAPESTAAPVAPVPIVNSTPTRPSEDPQTVERKKNLTGQLFHHGDNFAVFNWNLSQVAFFSLSSGTVLSMEDRNGSNLVVDTGSYVSALSYSLCPVEAISNTKECTKPIYPEPVKTVKSEVLQVLSRRGISNDSNFLLISTERYEAARNTAFKPVADPFYSVYDLSGAEVFKLPDIAHSSGTYVFAMGISPDEPTAVFGVGGTMDVCNAENDYDMPALVTEVLIWTPKKDLKRISTQTRTPEVESLMSRFGLQEQWFSFFKWPSKEARHGC